jgi:LPXTG-site transpeptidase (sortase) family protein
VADLSLTKSVNNTSPKLGDTVTFTITITNSGSSSATNVQVTGVLPAGLSFVSANPQSGTSFSNPVWTIPFLAVNSSATLQVTATVTQVGSITNFVQVTAADQFDPDSTPNNNGTQTPVEDDEARAIIGSIFDPPTALKTFSAAGLPELEFRMVWINSGNTASINTQVTDNIPTGTTYVTSSVTCAPQGSSTTAGAASAPLIAAVPSSSCGYDAVNNRIQWEGSIGPDNGNLTEATAANEVVITFRVTVDNGVNQVLNRGFSRTDINANANFVEETVLGTSLVNSNEVAWNRSGSTGNNNNNNDPAPRYIPGTGFAPDVITALEPQPAELAYDVTDFWLEIPSLKVKMPIVGVPYVDGKWDVSWLDTNAGWLNGTAFPTWNGNSVLTGHVGLASGKPGPFANLGSLKYGDQIIVHINGQKYIYEVQTNQLVTPSSISSLLKHEESSWITLVTCKYYNEKTGEYSFRTVVRAALIKVVDQ